MLQSGAGAGGSSGMGGSPPLFPWHVPDGAPACTGYSAAHWVLSPLGQPDWGLGAQLPARLLTRSLTLLVGHLICLCLGPGSGWSSR